MRILILCTGNSCRSQMAQGILKSLDKDIRVYSAGTDPSAEVHPKAIRAMKEIGIDISHNRPKHVDQFLDQRFNHVITVCDGANETCPAFTGDVKKRHHIGFDDPAAATGSEEEIMNVFRRIRDEIKRDFDKFYNENLRNHNI